MSLPPELPQPSRPPQQSTAARSAKIFKLSAIGILLAVGIAIIADRAHDISVRERKAQEQERAKEEREEKKEAEIAAQKKREKEKQRELERKNAEFEDFLSKARQSSDSDTDLALSYLQRAKEFFPELNDDTKKIRATYFHLLGELYAHKKQWDESESAFSKAILADPESNTAATAYANRATVVVNRSDDYERAIADYSAAIRIAQNSSYAYSRRANAYYQKSRYKQALDDCNRAIALDPRDAYSYYVRGNTCWYLGDKDQYREDRNKAHELDSDYNAPNPGLFGPGK